MTEDVTVGENILNVVDVKGDLAERPNREGEQAERLRNVYAGPQAYANL